MAHTEPVDANVTTTLHHIERGNRNKWFIGYDRHIFRVLRVVQKLCVSQTVLVETQKELTFDKTKIDFFATKVKTLEQEKEEQQKEILRLNKIIENIGILKDKLKL